MRVKIYHLDHKDRERLRGRLRKILEPRREILFAYLYGSFVTGLPFHDLDVGVHVAEITEDETTDYALDLAHRLSTEVKLPVDVRILNFAPVVYLYQVLRGDPLLVRNELVHTQILEQTIQKYLDLQPMIYRGVKEAFAA